MYARGSAVELAKLTAWCVAAAAVVWMLEVAMIPSQLKIYPQCSWAGNLCQHGST